jgi:O-methyltransferase
MLEQAKDAVLNLARRAGYEILKQSDPRLAAAISREPACAPEITLDAALGILRDHAGDEHVAARIFDAVLREAVAPQHRSLFWGDRLLTLDKSAAFRSDPRFAAAMQGVSSDTGATQYASPDGISWRLNTLAWAARTALDTPGDFVECGVYKGDMSWVVTELVDLAEAQRTFYLYDTFEGFSLQYSSEDDFPLAPQFFHIADRGYSAPQLYESVRGRFSGKPYVKVIKGVVPDILREISPDKIAFMHIDMNSSAPEIGALELLFERVSPGGVVIFDDYGWLLHRKQKDAADRFMSDHGHEILELPTGQGLLIKR